MAQNNCWEVKGCNNNECPAYQVEDVQCWLVSGHQCHSLLEEKFDEKFELCLECQYFNDHVTPEDFNNTLKSIRSQFKRYKENVNQRSSEMRTISMDLAVGLSESFDMLQKLSKGDTSARVTITSQNDLLQQLEVLLNATADKVETMIDQHHELAVGLCEHYDTLSKVAKGDHSARANEDSDDELVAKLGLCINQVTERLTELLREVEDTSLELALGLSENFDVLKRVAQGDLSVQAPETAKNEILAKLGQVVNQTVATLKQSFDNLQESKLKIEIELLEKKRMEKELRVSEEKFRTLTENINVGIFRTTPGAKGKFLEANRAILEMFGYKIKREFLDLNVSTLYAHPEDRKKFSHQLNQDGFVRDAEQMLKRCDGSVFWGKITASAVYNDRGEVQYFDGIIEDVTLRKEADQRQEELIEQLQNVNKELKDFAYIVSHDLKAPLRGIGSLVDWMETDFGEKLGEDGQEMLKLIHGRVMRMNDLINGILQYSRVGRIKEEKVNIDLNELVVDVIDLVSPPNHIQIKVVDQLPSMQFEKTRMVQVFQNLVSNAVKYNDKDEGTVEIGCEDEDGNWKFHVTDNGPGIDEKYYGKVFQIFQTLAPRDEVESTGVGLSVVKKIIEQYNGKIWLESEMGFGSTFFFTLPH